MTQSSQVVTQTDVRTWDVLVVEDEFDSLQVASKVLQHRGIRVHTARSGDECFEILKALSPTLIVTDLAMPDVDGWAVLVAVRANPATSHIPVVAVTAYDSTNVSYNAARAGFDGYFPKPISALTFVDQLIAIVQSRFH